MTKARVRLLGIQAPHTHFVAATGHVKSLGVALRRGGFGRVKALAQDRPVARCYAQVVDRPRLNSDRQRQFAQGAVSLGLIQTTREHEVQSQCVDLGACGIGHEAADVVLQGDVATGGEASGRRQRKGVGTGHRSNGVSAIDSGARTKVQVQDPAHGIAMRSQSDGDRRTGLAVGRSKASRQFLPRDLYRTHHIGWELGDCAARGNHLVVDLCEVGDRGVLDADRLDGVFPHSQTQQLVQVLLVTGVFDIGLRSEVGVCTDPAVLDGNSLIEPGHVALRLQVVGGRRGCQTRRLLCRGGLGRRDDRIDQRHTQHGGACLNSRYAHRAEHGRAIDTDEFRCQNWRVDHHRQHQHHAQGVRATTATTLWQHDDGDQVAAAHRLIPGGS